MDGATELMELKRQLLAVQALIKEYGSHRSLWNVEDNIKQRMEFYEKK